MLNRSSVLAVAIAAFGLAAAYPAGAAPFGVDLARPKNGQTVARPAGGNPALSRPARPAFNKPVSPVVTRPANPVIAKPVFTRPSNPVVTKPAGPVVTRPSNPAVAKPVFTKPTNPILTKPATPVLTNPANPGGLAAKPDVSAVSKPIRLLGKQCGVAGKPACTPGPELSPQEKVELAKQNGMSPKVIAVLEEQARQAKPIRLLGKQCGVAGKPACTPGPELSPQEKVELAKQNGMSPKVIAVLEEQARQARPIRLLGKQCGVAGKPACTPGPELSPQEKVELAKQNGMSPKVIAVLEEQARQARPIRLLGKQCGVAGKPACTPGPQLSLQEKVELAKQNGMSPKIIAVLEAQAARERAQKEQAQKEQAQKEQQVEDQGGGGANADQGGGDGKGSKVVIITPPIAFPGGPFTPAYQPAESPVYAPARPAPVAMPARPAPVAAPARPAPSAPPSCLSKEYLQGGLVMFRDTCSEEWAMNTSTEQRPVTAASARTCLAKENLAGGVVLFRDLCSGEWAKNPADQQAEAPAR